MTGFFPLLRLQLLSRYADLKPRNLKTQFREKKGRTIGMIIGILFAVVYLGGFLIFLENGILSYLMKMGMPDLLLSMAITMSMLGTLIISFFFIMSSLYFGRDAAHIASLPVKSRTVLAAKLTQVWISEVGYSVVFILPAAILYGIRVGADPLLYLRALLAALGAPILPIVLVSFVSTLLIRLSSLWKHRDMIATVSGIVFIGAYMFLAFNMGSLSGGGEMEDFVASFLGSNMARVDALTRAFPPAAWAAKGALGDWGQLLLFLAVCAIAAAFAVWVIGFWYRNLSMLQGETPATARKKGGVRSGSFTGGSAFKALCMREIRQILRVPSYATNSLPTCLMPAFMVGMMYFAFSRSGADGESLDMVLGTINADLILPILTAVMAYMSGMNPALSTSVSREGKGHDFLTALPVSSRTMVLSKLTVGYAMSLAGVALASAALAVLLPKFALYAGLAFVLCALYTYMTACLVLARDVKHPKLDWVTEQEAMKQNFGAAIGMFMGWGILIALAGLTYLLFTWEVGLVPYFLIMAALLSGGCVLTHWLLMRAADKYYCQG
ncbi:MAG: hypothetical protein IKO52_03715 [Clostridia bacterium]|nr:hypothetical protein [Clostridia bacterium]